MLPDTFRSVQVALTTSECLQKVRDLNLPTAAGDITMAVPLAEAVIAGAYVSQPLALSLSLSASRSQPLTFSLSLSATHSQPRSQPLTLSLSLSSS